MRYTQRYWTRVITLVCILFSVAIAQDGPRGERAGVTSAVEEAALRTLAGEFYAAYARKGMDGLLRLGSAKSPELASRRTVMQKFFAEHEKIELKGLAIRLVAGFFNRHGSSLRMRRTSEVE